MYPERQNLESHVEKDCPLAPVDCDFYYAGCEVKLTRQDMPTHLAESLVTHISLLAAHSRKAVGEKELNERIRNLEQKLQENEQKIVKLERDNKTLRTSLQTLQSYTGILPVSVTMTNFQRHKRNKDVWFSEPFYTHPHGYKMCLGVNANGSGDGEGTHISLCVYLMGGEFDNHLRWPFQGDVLVQLVNRLEDREHYTHSFYFSDTYVPEAINRVTTGGRATSGCGESEFLPHTELALKHAVNRQYLKDDCLQFRVSRVTNISWPAQLEKQCLAIESCVCVPPFSFTMREFRQHKRDGDEWVSPSFYTHSRGYRMYISVNANGYASKKNTHVSLFVHLIRGEFDTYLQWPFQGNITIQLLNQLENSNHREVMVRFTSGVPSSSSYRATAIESAEGLGYFDFVSHSELEYNPAKNRQYLRDDCLRFTVTRVVVKSVLM